MRFLRFGLAWVLVCALAACGRSMGKGELLVFAAASTAEAMTEIGKSFEARTASNVRFSFGPSKDLAHQVRQGAPADLLVSADAETIESLVGAGLVLPSERRAIASNRLVVVVPADSKLQIAAPADLKRANHIALADPAVAPAGAYAKKWLESQGLWNDVADRIIPTLDVRAALAAVASGRVESGVVYATDAATSAGVRVAYEVPPAGAPDIVYVAGRIVRSKNPASTSFLELLGGDEARATFAHHGFSPPASSP
jgi:molybdate transport system substrate-binding protein